MQTYDMDGKLPLLSDQYRPSIKGERVNRKDGCDKRWIGGYIDNNLHGTKNKKQIN